MEYREGTDVYSADGDKLGSVERVVLTPANQEVTHLVVEKGFFFPEERVIPVAMVASATGERISLNEAIDLEDLPRYQREHYIAPGGYYPTGTFPTQYNNPAYYYGPLPGTTTPWSHPGLYPPIGTRFVVDTDRNIPPEAVPLSTGADVVTEDGEKVGDVEQVITDTETHYATHFVISQGLIFKDHKLVPTDWIRTVSGHEVQLGVNKALLEDLPDYEMSS